MEVINRERRAAEHGLGSVVAGVSSGFLELGDDVDERECAAAELARQGAYAAHAPLDVGDAAARELVSGHARALEHSRGNGIALGVHGRGIKRILSARDAQEARRVEKRLGTELGNLLELAAVGEGAVLLAIRHDVSRHGRRDARDVGEEARARGVHVHAHAVDHVLHHVAERAGELCLIKVVLVLAHADGLGRNLHELSERILQAPAQAHRAARGDVEIGVLTARELGGGVDRRARLVDDGVAQVGRELCDELGDDLLGLPAGRAVTDDDGVDVVAAHEARELALGARDIVAGLGGVHHSMVEQLARLVEHRDLAPSAIPRVESDDARPTHRPCREQALRVLGKDPDGIRLGANGELGARLSLERGGHEALVAVGDGGVEHRCEDTLSARPSRGETGHGSRLVNANAHAELLLALAAVDGKDTVVGNLGEGLGEVVVGLVGGLLVRVSCHGDDLGRGHGEVSQVRDVLGVLGHRLRHDVLRASERALRRFEARLGRLRRHERRRRVERGPLGGHLHEDHVGQRLEPRLARLLRARHALLAVGPVEVLHALKLGGRLDL